MPPSVHSLTPLEKRLRRIAALRALGHEPAAPNCFWTRPEYQTPGKTCDACAAVRRKHPGLNRVIG